MNLLPQNCNNNKKREGSEFYTDDKGTPEIDVISDSVANGGTGDLRLAIRAQWQVQLEKSVATTPHKGLT